MKRTVLPLLALLSLVLSGCGGSNGSDSNGGGGQFEGLYDVVLSREGSPVRIEGPMTIDEDGDVNGTFEGDEFGTAVLDGRVYRIFTWLRLRCLASACRLWGMLLLRTHQRSRLATSMTLRVAY